jgi:hypothetical protein
MTTEIYKKAAQKKIRFETSFGMLTSEQLFDLTLNQLDELAVSYNEANERSTTKSFLSEKTEENKIVKLKFDIVLDVLNTKLANQQRAAKTEETKLRNQKILNILQQKKDSELMGLSIEELEAKLNQD